MRASRTLHVAAAGGASGAAEAPSRQPPHLVLVAGASPLPDHAARRQDFGPRLKAAREGRGVSLDEIARATKVSPGLLHALERSDVSRWPKGIFRRAFFRDYIAAIGLAPDAHVREFLELFPDGEEHPVAPPVAAASAPAPDAGPSLRLTLAARPTWPMRSRELREAAADLPAVLALALGLWWWTDASWIAGAGTVAICYYPRAAAAIRRRVRAAWRSRMNGGKRG